MTPDFIQFIGESEFLEEAGENDAYLGRSLDFSDRDNSQYLALFEDI